MFSKLTGRRKPDNQKERDSHREREREREREHSPAIDHSANSDINITHSHPTNGLLQPVSLSPKNSLKRPTSFSIISSTSSIRIPSPPVPPNSTRFNSLNHIHNNNNNNNNHNINNHSRSPSFSQQDQLSTTPADPNLNASHSQPSSKFIAPDGNLSLEDCLKSAQQQNPSLNQAQNHSHFQSGAGPGTVTETGADPSTPATSATPTPTQTTRSSQPETGQESHQPQQSQQSHHPFPLPLDSPSPSSTLHPLPNNLVQPSQLNQSSLPIISHQLPSPSSDSHPTPIQSLDAHQTTNPSTPRQLPAHQTHPGYTRHRSVSNITTDSASLPPSLQSRDSHPSNPRNSGPPAQSPTSNPSISSHYAHTAESTTSLASSTHSKPHRKRKSKSRHQPSATALALSGVALLASPAPLGWSDPMQASAQPTPPDDRSVVTADGRSTVRSRAPSQIDDQLGTGYAVASRKRNADFHAIFKSVPADDYLIEDYGCALQRDILVQGRLYISEQHLCFNANIFGWVTTLVVPFSDVATIEKRMTALIIPNAIQVATMHSRHTFASFLARDATFDLLTSIWRIAHPTVPPPSLPSSQPPASPEGGSDNGVAGDGVHIEYTGEVPSGPSLSASQVVQHPPTECACMGTEEHFKELVWEAEYPVSPEKLYGILFQSEFVREFWVNDEHLTEIEVSEWTKGPNALFPTRTISYVRPLTAAMGPKLLRCLIVEEQRSLNFDVYISIVTTTRTPDAPTGGSFCVKTSTCIMWAKNGGCKLVVTGGVEWSKVNRFLKSIIESSAIGGQKTYHQELDKALRRHIAQTQPVPDGDGLLRASGSSSSSSAEAGPTMTTLDGPTRSATSMDKAARVSVTSKQAGLGTSWRMMVAVGVAGLLLLVNLMSISRSSGGTGQVIVGLGPATREELSREVAGTVREALEEYFKDTQRVVGMYQKESNGQVVIEGSETTWKERGEEVREIEELLETIERRIRNVRKEIVDEKFKRLNGGQEKGKQRFSDGGSGSNDDDDDDDDDMSSKRNSNSYNQENYDTKTTSPMKIPSSSTKLKKFNEDENLKEL